MVINSQTKISALLKHHSDALEAIVTLSPDFKKLRNPILRKLMAGRTTISMASKIGGCKPEDFFNVLKPFGFETDGSSQTSEEIIPEKKVRPQFMQDIRPERLVCIDVRSMLDGGEDPLKLIQQTVKGLGNTQILKIINTFEPTPLIHLLNNQGFQSYTDFIDQDVVETYFSKTGGTESVPDEITTNDSNDWDLLSQKYGNSLLQIDVRHLEMPQPMITILEALETLPSASALLVCHKRIPVFLLTELKERDFDFRIKKNSESEVNLLIFRK
jgi:uncharacterized protein (DUF2249 family)